MTTILKILVSAMFFLLGFFGPTLAVYILEQTRILHKGFLIDNPRLLVVFLGIGVAAAAIGWRIGTRILPQKRS